MNAKNLPLKFGILAVLVALCLWSLYTKELRQGIDLKGGTSMIFEIKTSEAERARLAADIEAKQAELAAATDEAKKKELQTQIDQQKAQVASLAKAEGDSADLTERIINVLKERVDPQGLSSLEWSPMGRSRIEVRMPAGTTASRDSKLKYDEAIEKVEKGNLQRSDLWDVMNAAPADRAGVIARVSRGDAEIARLLTDYVAANDALAAAKSNLDKAQARVDEVPATTTQPTDAQKKLLDELTAAETAFEAAQARMADATDKVQSQNVTRGALQNVFRSYISATEASALRNDTEVKRRREAFASSLDRLLKEHPNRKADIEMVVAAYKKWAEVRRQLDDPADLIRLIRNAGVLEFRIAPVSAAGQAGSKLIMPPEKEAYYKKVLQNPDQGPEWLRRQNSEFLWFPVKNDTEKFGGLVTGDFGGRTYVLLYNQPGFQMLQQRGEGGWSLTRARVTSDQNMQPAVGFDFNEKGASLFGDMTEKHKGDLMAILLDDEVFSAPRINARITSSGIIEGNFTQEEASSLARVLEKGSLPAKLNSEPVAVNTFGPSFGEENLQAALRAGFWGTVGTVAFMLVYYMFAGMVANVALALQVLLILGAMSMLGAVFTLPGIAGLILTVGMAVDANVLIYERLREEQLRGLSIRMALKNAYERAFSAIFDSNTTTLITCAILGWVATPEIRGFAITLGLGVVFNIFTAVYVTRWVFQVLLERGWVAKPLSMLRLIGVPNINWMAKRYYFWAFSLITGVFGLFALFAQGKDILGIEFSSGTKATITFKDDALINGKLPNDQMVETVFRDKARASGNEKLINNSRVEKVVTNRLAHFMNDHDKNSDGKVTREEWIGQGLNGPFFDELDVAAKAGGALTAANLKDSLPANSYQIVTTETRLSQIQPVLATAFTGALEQRQRIEFELIKGGTLPDMGVSLAADGKTQINKAMLQKAAQKYHKELIDAEGGVLLAVKVQTPISVAEAEQRIREMRFQPDFSQLALNSSNVIGLTSAGGDKFSELAVLVTPSDSSIASSSKAWSEFADKELGLLGDSLHRQEAMVATNFDAAIAGQTSQAAIMAMVLSWMAIIIYLWVRFGTLRWGLAAVVCLVHDSIIMLGLIAASSWIAATSIGHWLGVEPFKLDLAMIAALLTIIGYSVNDTIVVFDRIRENRGKLTTVTPQVINMSINQTLSRTLLTSSTVFLVVVVMYIWGGPGIHGFNYALAIGILFGTYSSIAVAAPILLGLREMVTGHASAATEPTAK